MVGYTRDYLPPTLVTRNILRAHNFPEEVWESLNDNRRLNAVVLDQRVIEQIVEPDRTALVAKMVLTPEKCNHFEEQSRLLREPIEQSWREKLLESKRQMSKAQKRIFLEALGIVLLMHGVLFATVAFWPDTLLMMVVATVAWFCLLFWLIFAMQKQQSRLTPSYVDHFVDFYTAQKRLLLKLWSEQNQ